MVEEGKGTDQGKNESDLIEEKIDEVILRALGLDDVFDLDYGTYKTLLKERMVADRMGQKMDTSEIEAVTNEYKRIKAKSGRFRVNKKKITAESFKTRKTDPTSAPIRDTKKLLPGSTFAPPQKILPPTAPPESPKEETAIVQAPQQQEKTNQVYTYNFSKIESALDDISKMLQQSFSFEKEKEKKKNQEEGRRKKKDKESMLEKTVGAIAKIGKKILEPLKGPLDYIFNFIKYTFLGRVVNNLLNWFTDPNNAKKIESIGRFLKDWWPALVGAYLIFGTSLGRFVSKLIFTVGAFSVRLLKFAIPKLLSVIARNPVAAAVVGGVAAVGGSAFLANKITGQDEAASVQADQQAKVDRGKALPVQGTDTMADKMPSTGNLKPPSPTGSLQGVSGGGFVKALR